LDGDRWTPAFRSYYTRLDAFLTTPLIYDTCVFQPAVWSRLHNEWNVITSTDLAPVPGYLHRRVPRWANPYDYGPLRVPPP
jgi:hypothetical protein